MMDLHDRFDEIAGPVSAPSPAEADQDVARGRRALRRRRAVRGAGASVFAVAALAAAIAYGAGAGPSHDNAPVVAAPAVVSTQLVAYRGEQPKGFTIDKVPAGWEVQGVNAASLTIAPVGAKDKNPDSFVDKIAIMLQSQDATDTPTGTAVQVGGKPGVINQGLGTDHGKNLWVKQPNGIWMLVQIWDARGWTDAAMVEFGAGIHVLPGAVQGRG
jgi:hypothetical protein